MAIKAPFERRDCLSGMAAEDDMLLFNEQMRFTEDVEQAIAQVSFRFCDSVSLHSHA